MTKRILILGGVLALLPAHGIAWQKISSFKARGGYATVQRTAATPEGALVARQGYGLRIWESNLLMFGRGALPDAHVPVDSNCGVEIGASYPVGSCVEHLYVGMPLIGAILTDTVNHTTRVVTDAGYYDQFGLSPGPPTTTTLKQEPIWNTSVDDTTYDDSRPGYYKRPMNRRGYDDDHDGKIDEDELDGLDNDHDWIRSTDDIGADGVPDSMEVGCKGKYDPITNPDPAGDDYDPSAYDSCHPRADGSYRLKNDKNLYTELNGIPDHGEPHVDEDYGAVSDNDIYSSATDTLTTPVSNHPKMGLKIFYKSYAFRTQNENENAILPIDFAFINLSHYRWDSVYVGFFADEDVGPVNVPAYYTHNYAAYDTTYQAAYVVNPVDRGSTPLAVTLIEDTSSAKRPARTIFRWWSIGGGPVNSDISKYSYLSGNASPNQLIQPNQSLDSLSDTRVLISMGPFGPIGPNDTVHMSMAFVAGYCVEGCPGNLMDNVAIVHGHGPPPEWPSQPPVYPRTFELSQSYPNPFNPVATIYYELPVASKVTLTVYDVLGRPVAKLVDGETQNKGYYWRTFNGSKYPSGVYFYKLQASSVSGSTSNYSASGKMVLVR